MTVVPSKCRIRKRSGLSAGTRDLPCRNHERVRRHLLVRLPNRSKAASCAPHRYQPVRIRKIVLLNRHFDCGTCVGRRDGADQPGLGGSAVDIPAHRSFRQLGPEPHDLRHCACIDSYRARTAAFASSRVSAEPLFGGGATGAVCMNHSHRTPPGSCSRRIRPTRVSPSTTAKSSSFHSTSCGRPSMRSCARCLRSNSVISPM